MTPARILIVEDEIIVAKDVQLKLQSLGYSLAPIATSGEKALQEVARRTPDLVLMDVMLRGAMDGIEAAQQIKERCAVPVIYLTAYSDDEMLKRAKLTEPYGYLLKPVDPKELQVTIEMALYKAEMEGRVRENEDRYRTLVETAPDVIFTIAADDESILSLNRSFETITGWTCAEWTGKSFLDLIHPDDVSLAAEKHRRVLEGKRTEPFELRVLSKSGDYLIGEFIEIPQVKNEKLVGILGFCRDITDRKKMEEELIKTKKLESIGVLSRGIAHDYNNLLSVIMGAVSIGKLYVRPNDKVFSILEKVEEASNKAKDLTSRLLKFSKVGVPRKKPVMIADLLKDTANFVLSGMNTHCEFSIAEDLWPVTIDEAEIGQATAHVITNAQEAMAGRGTIRIHARNMAADTKKEFLVRAGNYVVISIQDEGVGIPEEHLGRVFDPYFSTKEIGTQKGMGLGLAVTHSIIEQHAGYMSLESEVGRGTTFHILLPALMSKPGETETGTAITTGGKKKVLLMDDKTMIRETTGKMLHRLGYEISYARDGREAVALYKKAHEEGRFFDVVILDLTVQGGMGGEEAIRRILEIHPAARVFISSGYPDHPVMEHYERYGFCGAIVKPYTIQELGGILEGVLGAAQDHGLA